MTRLIVLILALIIAAGNPAAARCCSLGAGASCDYLGDSSMDIGMSSYDEFLRDNAPNSSVSADPAPDGEGIKGTAEGMVGSLIPAVPEVR